MDEEQPTDQPEEEKTTETDEERQPGQKPIQLYYYDKNRKKYFAYTVSGECELDKCNAACCRTRVIDSGRYPPNTKKEKINFYFAVNRATKTININNIWCSMGYDPCISLDEETNLCKIYEKRPIACLKFPIPLDPHHYYLTHPEEFDNEYECTLRITDIKEVKDKRTIKHLKKNRR